MRFRQLPIIAITLCVVLSSGCFAIGGLIGSGFTREREVQTTTGVTTIEETNPTAIVVGVAAGLVLDLLAITYFVANLDVCGVGPGEGECP